MFLRAVQMVPSCGLTVYFCIIFLIKENNPRRGQLLLQTNKAKHGRLTFTWRTFEFRIYLKV